MADTREVRTVFGWKYDAASGKTVEQGIERATSNLLEMEQAGTRANTALGELGSKPLPSAGTLGKFQQSVGRIDIGLSTLSRAMDETSAQAVRAVGDVAGLAEQLPNLAQGIQTLGVAGGVALAAVAALALVFGELTRQSAEARKEKEKELDATRKGLLLRREITELQEGGDVEAARTRLEKARGDVEQSNAFINKALADLAEINARYEAELYGNDPALFRLQAIKGEREAVEDAIAAERLLNAERLAELLLLEQALPGIEATTDARQQEKRAAEDVLRFLQGIGPAAEKATKPISEAFARAQKDIEDRQNKMIRSTEGFNADIERINAQGYEEAARLADEYNQKLIDLADEARAAAGKALERLQEQRSQLATQLARDEADAQRQLTLDRIDAQIENAREEERAAREHARNLRNIRERAADGELQAIANRDFQSLFFQRRQTARELQEASRSFIEERQERRIAYSQQLADLARAYETERQARLIKYQQDLADAQIAYNREQAAIIANLNTQRQRAMQGYNQAQRDLSTSIATQLQTRRSGYIAELQLAQQTAQARVAIEQQLLNQARSALQGIQSAAYSANYNTQQTNTYNVTGTNAAMTAAQIAKLVQAGWNAILR